MSSTEMCLGAASTKWLRRQFDRAPLADDRAGHRRRDRRLRVKTRNAARTGSHCLIATATPVIVAENLDTEIILVSRVEAARLLSISVAKMDRLRRNGEMVAWRKGRRVPCVVSELQRYADTLLADE
jgi:hypothetical protein